MFESLLANFVTSRAAQFIKHIPQEQLRVGVLRGEIVVDDLELRADCLDGLGLPLTLEAGYVGSLRISIPWSSLGSKPVVAELERVHLILRLQVPKKDRDIETGRQGDMQRHRHSEARTARVRDRQNRDRQRVRKSESESERASERARESDKVADRTAERQRGRDHKC